MPTILSIHSDSVAHWHEYRGQRMAAWAAEHQINWVSCSNRSITSIREGLETHRPALAIFEVACPEPSALTQILLDYPHIQFVWLLHGHDVMILSEHLVKASFALRATKIHRNFRVASVRKSQLTDLILPNLIPSVDLSAPTYLHGDPVQITCVARFDRWKGWGAAVLVVKKLRAEWDLEFNLCTNSLDAADAARAVLAPIPVRIFPWTDQATCLSALVPRTHLLLQTSFTDSLNMTSLEFALCGVPCLGSDAVEWLHEDHRASVQDIEGLVRRAEHILMNHAAIGQEQQQQAQRIQRENADLLLTNLRSLL